MDNFFGNYSYSSINIGAQTIKFFTRTYHVNFGLDYSVNFLKENKKFHLSLTLALTKANIFAPLVHLFFLSSFISCPVSYLAQFHILRLFTDLGSDLKYKQYDLFETEYDIKLDKI